jgi:hypothetical protein
VTQIASSGSTATLHHGLGKSPPEARRFWRVLSAVVAPLPALALAAAALVTPYPVETDAAAALAGAAADQGAMRIVVWLGLLAAMTLVPATIAVAWVCRRRAPKLTAVGAFLSLAAFGATAALPNGDLTALATAQNDLDRTVVVALDEAVWGQPTVVTALLIFLPGMVIGGILLGVALWRSGVVPRWMALALIVSAPLHLAPGFGNNALAALGWALTAVGYTGASMALLRMNNDAFDLPPVTPASAS